MSTNIDQQIQNLFQQAAYANSNKKTKNYKMITIKIATIIFIYMLGFFTNHFLEISFNIHKTPETKIEKKYEKISYQDKVLFRSLVKRVAKKENKHVNSIHSELRKIFNYRSYHQLDKETFQRVCDYLRKRLK